MQHIVRTGAQALVIYTQNQPHALIIGRSIAQPELVTLSLAGMDACRGVNHSRRRTSLSH
jgi:hypothetical protein